MANLNIEQPVYLRIRSYIQKQKLFMKTVAKKSEIKPGRFYRVMDGTSVLDADELEQICIKGLELNPGVFFEEKFLESKK